MLSRENPRYSYRRVWALLRREGRMVNEKRLYRLWREEGLKVPDKQHKRRRLGESENSCTRKRATHPNHVWSYDFVMDRTEDGRRLKMMPIADEYSQECLSIEVERSITAQDVVETLTSLFRRRGEPAFIRSDNGPEFIAKAIKRWLEVRPLVYGLRSPPTKFSRSRVLRLDPDKEGKKVIRTRLGREFAPRGEMSKLIRCAIRRMSLSLPAATLQGYCVTARRASPFRPPTSQQRSRGYCTGEWC